MVICTGTGEVLDALGVQCQDKILGPGPGLDSFGRDWCNGVYSESIRASPGAGWRRRRREVGPRVSYPGFSKNRTGGSGDYIWLIGMLHLETKHDQAIVLLPL